MNHTTKEMQYQVQRWKNDANGNPRQKLAIWRQGDLIHYESIGYEGARGALASYFGVAARDLDRIKTYRNQEAREGPFLAICYDLGTVDCSGRFPR